MALLMAGLYSNSLIPSKVQQKFRSIQSKFSWNSYRPMQTFLTYVTILSFLEIESPHKSVSINKIRVL